jgi:hypothetical protein
MLRQMNNLMRFELTEFRQLAKFWTNDRIIYRRVGTGARYPPAVRHGFWGLDGVSS